MKQKTGKTFFRHPNRTFPDCSFDDCYAVTNTDIEMPIFNQHRGLSDVHLMDHDVILVKG